MSAKMDLRVEGDLWALMYYKWLMLVATDCHRRWQPLTEVLYVKLCWYDWTNHFSGVDRFRVQQSFCRIQKARWNRMVYQLTRGKQGSTPIRHQFSISFNFVLLPTCFSSSVNVQYILRVSFSFSRPFILSVGYMYQILIAYTSFL
jgi:hypothetical protein